MLELQEMLQIYENLGLKNEFLRTLSHYALCVYQSGNLNKIKDIFIRFSLFEGFQSRSSNDSNQTTASFQINEGETIARLLSSIDEDTCKQLNIDSKLFFEIQSHKKKVRDKVLIFQQDKTFCGGNVERSKIFTQCLLPVLKLISEHKGINIIEAI